jgi:hypothetical protein
MLRPLVFVMLVAFAPVFSFADSAAEKVAARDAAGTEFVAGYLSRLKNKRVGVFYAECRLKDGGKAGIVIPLGGKDGLYIERSVEMTVVNTADLIWEDGQWRTEVAQGGLYTITRANNLIQEILGYSFQFLPTNRIDLVRTSRPKNTCAEKLPQ